VTEVKGIKMEAFHIILSIRQHTNKYVISFINQINNTIPDPTEAEM